MGILRDGLRHPASYIDKDDDETGHCQCPGENHQPSVVLRFTREAICKFWNDLWAWYRRSYHEPEVLFHELFADPSLFHVARHQQPRGSGHKPSNDHEGTVQLLQHSFRMQKYTILEEIFDCWEVLTLLEASVKYWMHRAFVIVKDKLLLSSEACCWILTLERNQPINQQNTFFFKFANPYSHRSVHLPSTGNEVDLNQTQCYLRYNGLDAGLCSEWSHQ
jgi:hypothetical protein